MNYPEQRHLFDLRQGGLTLSITIQCRGSLKTYRGYINGKLAALAPAKGQLLRKLLPLTRQPVAPAGVGK